MGLGYNTVVIKKDDTCLAVGKNDNGQCNVSAWTNIKQVDMGTKHTVAVLNNGTCIAVGDNGSGQCDVSTWTNVVQVSCGETYTVGVKSDGTIVYAGKVSDTTISTWTNIKQVACSSVHIAGLKNDGTVIAVGSNEYGQLNVTSWTNIVQIETHPFATVGLKSDGTCVAVGWDAYTLLNVTDWTDIIRISCGVNFTVGIKKDNTCVITGIDSQVKDVATWTNIEYVSCGNNHAVGLKKDGTCVACGDNTNGQCDVSDFSKVAGLAGNLIFKMATILFLLKQNSSYYTIVDGNLTLSASQVLDVANFENNGFSGLDSLNGIDKTGLKLLSYKDTGSDLTLQFTTKTSASILDRYDNLKLVSFSKDLTEMNMRFTTKEPYVILDEYENLELLAYNEANPDEMKLNCILKEPFKPIDKFDNTCEICSDYAEDELIIAVNGDRKERYRYKVEFNGEIVKQNSSLTYDEVNSSFTIPVDYINSIKNVSRETKFKITKINEYGDTEDNECTVTVNPQRIFSKTFNGATSYATIFDFNKALSELDIQVIKKASTDADFTVDESNALVSKVSNTLIIGKTSFVGDIYEVRIWEKDKKQEYNGQPLLGNEKGLYALFRMNEYDSDICIDSSENKFTGKYTNVTTSEKIPSNASSLYDAKITMVSQDTVEQKQSYVMNYKIEKPVEHEYNVYDLKLTGTNMVEIPINLSLFENIEGMKFLEK